MVDVKPDISSSSASNDAQRSSLIILFFFEIVKTVDISPKAELFIFVKSLSHFICTLLFGYKNESNDNMVIYY